MNKERIAREIARYLVGIFAMGLLSKGTQRIEQRREIKKKVEEEKESQEWKVTEKMVKQPNGTFKKEYGISRMISEEDLQKMRERSEDYHLRKQGFYVARVRPNKVEEKEKIQDRAKKVAKMAGESAANIMAEGAKRRVVYEFKDASRSFAKSSKDTEIFLKNNLKNHFKR